MKSIYEQEKFERSENGLDILPKEETIKKIKEKYELENLSPAERENLYNFIQTNQEKFFDIFISDEFIEMIEKASVRFDIDKEKLFRCLARNEFRVFQNYDFDNKDGLKDVDLEIEANIILDYYENTLKKTFGDKEFVIYMPSKEEESKFFMTDNLAQKMRIKNDTGRLISFSENQYDKEYLSEILTATIKKWTFDVCEKLNKEFPSTTIDQKIVQYKVSSKIRDFIEDNYKPFPTPWLSDSFDALDMFELSEEQKEEYDEFWDKNPLQLSQKRQKEYREIFTKSSEYIEETKDNNISDLDDLYSRYNISKINKEIESQNGSFHNNEENYFVIAFEGLQTFNTMRHEFGHEDNHFGWDEATPEALSILEEFLGIADAKEHFDLSDVEFFKQIKKEVELRIGKESENVSEIYRHVFENLLICRGLLLNKKPRNRKELDNLTHIEIAVIIKNDLNEYLDTKEKPAWFSDLENILDEEVKYAYKPGSEKYRIDHAIDYLEKNKSNA